MARRMERLQRCRAAFATCARGATMIEWTLIASLIAIALLASAAPIADTLRPYITDTTDAVVDIRTP